MARDRDDPRGHGQREVRWVHSGQPCLEVHGDRGAEVPAGYIRLAIWLREAHRLRPNIPVAVPCRSFENQAEV